MIFEVNWLCKRLFTKLAGSGMHSFVICERSRIGKWFFTNITDARLFTTLHSLMRPQGKSFSEGLDTKIACKFTILSCMRKFMTHKSSCLAETFVTLGTFMWLHSSMDPFVSFQLINLAEMFLTNFTNMRLHWNFDCFLSFCVSVHSCVWHKIRFLSKCFHTLIARVQFDLLVTFFVTLERRFPCKCFVTLITRKRLLIVVYPFMWSQLKKINKSFVTLITHIFFFLQCVLFGAFQGNQLRKWRIAITAWFFPSTNPFIKFQMPQSSKRFLKMIACVRFFYSMDTIMCL